MTLWFPEEREEEIRGFIQYTKPIQTALKPQVSSESHAPEMSPH